MDNKNRARERECCEVCGKVPEEYLEVHLGGKRHLFDSFECAMSGMLLRCRRCGGIILDSGVRVEGASYCSDSCASFSSHHYEAPLYLSE